MMKSNPTVRVISWKEDRSAEIADVLTTAGFAVDADTPDAAVLRAIDPSDHAAIVIDLGRLPAQGRDLGIMFRTRASTRSIPLVFVAGAEDKVARVRKILPDAVFTSRSEMSSAVTHAITNPPLEPVVPSSAFAGYSGTPLPKKLGIKPDSVVALVDAPDGFETVLGTLPDGVAVRHSVGDDAAVTLWFVRSLAELEDGIETMASIVGHHRLWVCWPKKASGIESDVTQNQVRSMGLATGIVDFKICAIDATWSGLCFTSRKK
jgi:hypothetical protein